MVKTTTNEGREQALAWIRRQLAWERTLTDLRTERTEHDARADEERRAA